MPAVAKMGYVAAFIIRKTWNVFNTLRQAQGAGKRWLSLSKPKTLRQAQGAGSGSQRPFDGLRERAAKEEKNNPRINLWATKKSVKFDKILPYAVAQGYSTSFTRSVLFEQCDRTLNLSLRVYAK
jgi:hypothetical protein